MQVKQILDKPRCKTLLECDLLQEINGIDVRQMTHAQIVQVLKDCPIGVETQIVVQRGGKCCGWMERCFWRKLRLVVGQR